MTGRQDYPENALNKRYLWRCTCIPECDINDDIFKKNILKAKQYDRHTRIPKEGIKYEILMDMHF
jgi:hypothetical protein